jgi:four helix bundle protein
MLNFAEEFKIRTKKFAVDVIIYCKSLPKSEEAFIIKKQLIRSATSVAANYRAVCRARSDAEFFSKLSIVVEEADESVFWIEIIKDANIFNSNETTTILNEATEILKIVAKSRKTLKDKKLKEITN